MMKLSTNLAEAAAGTDALPQDAPTLDRARPIPRISIQAFCEIPETAQAVQVAAEDRVRALLGLGPA